MATINQKKSNGRGGAGRGQGRKPGSLTKKTRAVAEKAAAEGITPLEVMLRAMRSMVAEAERIEREQRKKGETEAAVPFGLWQEAAAVAKDAAPYMHPRLSSVDLKATVATHEASLDELA